MSLGAGTAHLIEAARGNHPTVEPKVPAGKCVRVFVPLSGIEYFTDRSIGMEPGVVHFPGNVYSELRIDGKVAGVKKHTGMAVIGTGVILENIDVPSWWDKRDSGGF